MSAGSFRPSIASVLLVLGSASLAVGGEAAPEDYALEVRTDREPAEHVPGDTVSVTVGVVARLEGIQGWSYAVRHDPAVLELTSATIDGTDAAAALRPPSFELTLAVEDASGVRIGFIQGVVLSLTEPAALPAGDFLSLARASYTVLPCEAESPLETTVRIVEDLAAPNSPPVAINLTVDGEAVVPGVIEGATVRVECSESGLALLFGPEAPAVLAAGGDPSSTLDLEVRLANTASGGMVGLQGWSYGVRLDTSLLEPLAATPGADAAVLQAGAGPDFVHYNLDDASIDGSVRGVSVGVVIELGPPGTEVLPVLAGRTVHLDRITLRSRIVLGDGESRETQASFADMLLGGDRPIEVLFAVAGESVTPDSSATKTITLEGNAQSGALYLRGDANSDRRVDIADGVWIVNMLFYKGRMTACRPAADATSDGRIDVTDALYIIRYQLQPGATPQSLFPRPGPPFPECGLDPEADPAECPRGSHICSA